MKGIDLDLPRDLVIKCQEEVFVQLFVPSRQVRLRGVLILVRHCEPHRVGVLRCAGYIVFNRQGVPLADHRVVGIAILAGISLCDCECAQVDLSRVAALLAGA